MGEENILQNRIIFGIIFIVVIAVALFLNTSSVNAATTISACTGVYTCGQNVNTTGYGAVELCNTCFACGASDGVCPSFYSDGLNESNLTKQVVLMKISELSRPSVNSSYVVNYPTGNQACAVIGGTCKLVEYRLNNGETQGDLDSSGSIWQESQDVTCTRTVTAGNYPEAYRAVCEAVPRTASCDECPDPDCTVQLAGITYNGKTGQLIDNAAVNVRSDINPSISITSTSSDGYYSMNATAGNVLLLCSAAGFLPTQKEIYLAAGKNLIDCPLSYAACSAECTLPDENGANICRSNCHEENGCYFQTDPTYDFIGDVCEGVAAGSFVTLERINATHIKGVSCCEGAVVIRESPQFNPGGANIKNLITKNFRKELNGVPVTLKIMVYEKND